MRESTDDLSPPRAAVTPVSGNRGRETIVVLDAVRAAQAGRRPASAAGADGV
jgi:hypothetical protein